MATYVLASFNARPFSVLTFVPSLNTRRVVRGKGTDRQGNTASNNNTNMFHLGTRIPSLGPREMDGWETAYTASSAANVSSFLNISFLLIDHSTMCLHSQKDVYLMESLKSNSDSLGSPPYVYHSRS